MRARLARCLPGAHLDGATKGCLVFRIWKERGEVAYRDGMRRIRTNVGPGWRSLVGVLLIFGGMLGFLPILGFWMIPLGVAVILLDIRVFRRWRRIRANGRP
jgi:hypothetical protein